MAEADDKTTTSRFLTLWQAAELIGWEELKFALIEGRLLAYHNEDWIDFEELDRFRQTFLLRGVLRDDLDAVRAISVGAPIPRQSFRRWFGLGVVSSETGEIIRRFEGHHRVVIFRPVLLSADVTALRSPTTDRPAQTITADRADEKTTSTEPRIYQVIRDLTKQEFPKGHENVSTGVIRHRVGDKMRDMGLPVPSRDTFDRALGRRAR